MDAKSMRWDLNTLRMKQTCRFAWVLFGFIGLSGCATQQSTIGWEVTLCCEADVSGYRSYSIEYQDVPGFLEKYLAGGLGVALAEKGLTRNDAAPDAVIRLSFSQKFVGSEQPTEPYFGDEVEPGGATSFLASILMEMRDASSGDVVWSGVLSRIHHLPQGGELSQAHKLAGIQQGFVALFKDYPGRISG